MGVKQIGRTTIGKVPMVRKLTPTTLNTILNVGSQTFNCEDPAILPCLKLDGKKGLVCGEGGSSNGVAAAPAQSMRAASTAAQPVLLQRLCGTAGPLNKNNCNTKTSRVENHLAVHTAASVELAKPGHALRSTLLTHTLPRTL